MLQMYYMVYGEQFPSNNNVYDTGEMESFITAYEYQDERSYENCPHKERRSSKLDTSWRHQMILIKKALGVNKHVLGIRPLFCQFL